MKIYRSLFIFGIFFGLAVPMFGQSWNRFSGKSVVLDALDMPPNGACSLRYGGNVNVRIDQDTPANPPPGSIKVCPSGQTPMDPNNQCTSPSGFEIERDLTTGSWEFWGLEPSYRVTLTHTYGGSPSDKQYTYRWKPDNESDGIYNVKEYGAKGNGVNDDWFSIQSALAAAAANNGGVVYFPSGDYILREGITVPSGIIVRGNGGLVSDGLTNFTLVNRGPTRIRLTGNELMKSDAIFLIGECSQQIRFENLELKGTVPGEEFGVELLGKATSSQDIQFSNVGFTDLNIGIYAHALPSSNGLSWQVDYLKVDNCFFNRNTNAGIYVNAFNSNWSITNSIFHLLPKIAATRPSNAIYALRSGAINVEKSYAVGQSESSGGRGGDFVHAEFTGPITVSDSSVEGMSNGLAVGNEPVSVGGATYYASDYSYPITLKGNILGRSVEIRGRRNIVSIGNLYYPTAFINSVDHEVRIYSLGDRFCYDQIPEQPDPENSAQTCLEPRSTDFGEATIVFRTGQLGNGTGERAAGGPTKFGFDVEIQADNATALETVGTPLLSVLSPPTFYDGKPLLRLGDRNSYYDLGRNGSGTLVFDAGPVEPQLPINPYRGFAFERPVRLPSFRYEDLQTGAGYFSTMGIGTTVFCTDCQRQSSPCSLASSGGGAIAIVNLISGYFGWQCQ